MNGLGQEGVAELQRRARDTAHNSYSPYSGFQVGAALLVQPDEGETPVVVTGTNVENASYRLTSCAEQAAIAAAVSQYGPKIRVLAVAVANLNGAAAMPCGACRQTLAEFASPEAPVFYPAADGATVQTTLGDLLPASFRLNSN